MKRKKGKYLLTQHLANQVATEVMSADDHAIAEVGSHTVNGEERHVVHVTYKDNVARAHTISKLAW